jgi:hypothetical protein
MSTQNLDYGYILVVFDGDEDLSWVHKIQDKHEKDKLIYVARKGTTDKYLYPDRFVVENYEASMSSHFLWNGKILPEEEDEYILELALKFRDTGKQIYIEEYEFNSSEPFYDYSK